MNIATNTPTNIPISTPKKIILRKVIIHTEYSASVILEREWINHSNINSHAININRDPNNPERDRIDVRGSQQDLMNFGSELGGEKMEGYEVFWTQDDDRGEIVRIVKSDSINEKKKKDDRCTRIAKRKFDTWPSAYASGAVVRCRKGKIWKGIK